MALIVQKYGGTSLASPRHIRAAAHRIASLRRTGAEVVVVVSAMGRMTDHLIRLAYKTVSTPPQRELDMLMTAGERVSMALLAMALHGEGIDAISFTGSQSGIITTSDHTDAKILELRGHRIREELNRGRVVIVAGFQGVSREREITTLGRGGSDTTAVAIAATLGAELCEVLTDVDGIFTADPRLVSTAELISQCSYDEALELASLGAKMQSRSIEMARRYRVKVRVCSSRTERPPGTEIGEYSMEATEIKGIATRDGYHYFRVQAELPHFTRWLTETKSALRFLQAGPDGIGFLCEEDKVPRIRKSLEGVGQILADIDRIAIVSVVGNGVGRCPDFLQRFLAGLITTDCQPLLVTTNALSLTAAIPRDRRERLSQILHQEFLEKKDPLV